MTLMTWAHKYDPKVARAKASLATLKPSETGHGAAVPWAFADRAVIKSKHDDKEINARIRKASIEELPIDDDDLVSIQHSVKASQVRFYLEHPNARGEGHINEKSNTPDDYPIVIQQDGVKYLWDGNHRLTAMYLAGKRKAEVRFVNFDE